LQYGTGKTAGTCCASISLLPVPVLVTSPLIRYLCAQTTNYRHRADDTNFSTKTSTEGRAAETHVVLKIHNS